VTDLKKIIKQRGDLNTIFQQVRHREFNLGALEMKEDRTV
jgi:hypothetical protein